MTTEKMYNIGEVVLVPMTVIRREFDDRGKVKYQLKDQKAGKILDWYYADNDIHSSIVTKKKKEEEKTED